ncbi:sigma 54-interacting transcriptional regulator [Bacillus pseudomycoides]|uniref:sigma-54 interaction domain-containing protein n=1 Tax=Bacillus TaxID=1386 RepID=UPI002248BD30|nr:MULTISPECIES: sigma 54-interacting transcriptional regulator [Bacillus]MCX2827693.1 sigma 54-interacting transcriptional regulator [Bacillus sp. DHT2]MDR4916526.1 sigma 54-interacting transcriptional regulator [Bacillus pseudomycoides]
MSTITAITKIIHTFSELLQIEIAYFNHEGLLVSSTEEYKKKKGERVYLPFFQKLYEHPITFVHKPGHMNMCHGCHFQKSCPSTAEIIQNMIQNERHYGYLSFVSFSKNKQQKLIDQQKEFIYWMEKLKGIITAIIHETNYSTPTMGTKLKQTEYILGNSHTLQNIKEILKNMKSSTSSIVITGETGTGKSLMAKLIHEQSMFQRGDFIEINCASIPESLFESELFGYEEGAFTGARKKGKPGYFEMANRGTLFLDEIADLPLHLQPKLLKVLQDGVVQRIGGTLPKKVNIRIIAASNQSLEKLMESKQFRSDLYYRLNVIPIHLPPLRERKEDLKKLVPFLIEKLQTRTGKFIQTYTDDFLEKLKQYHWPGNIRELENILEYSMNMEKSSQLTQSSLPGFLQHNITQPQSPSKECSTLKEAEKESIIKKLHYYGYDYEGKKQAAADLGISVRTLYRKMEKLGISGSTR